MYQTVITVFPNAPTASLQKLTVGQNSYSEIKIVGIPTTATSITLVITPVDEEDAPVPFSVDIYSKTVLISEAMFPDVGDSTYEIYFRKDGHNYWCGRGAYEVEATSLGVDTGSVINDIYADKVVRGEVTIAINTRMNFVETDITLYDLLSAYVVSPAGAIVAYSVSNVQVQAEGFEVYYNATVLESGYMLRYSLMMKG